METIILEIGGPIFLGMGKWKSKMQQDLAELENSPECMLSVPKIVSIFTALIGVKFEATFH